MTEFDTSLSVGKLREAELIEFFLTCKLDDLIKLLNEKSWHDRVRHES